MQLTIRPYIKYIVNGSEKSISICVTILFPPYYENLPTEGKMVNTFLFVVEKPLIRGLGALKTLVK